MTNSRNESTRRLNQRKRLSAAFVMLAVAGIVVAALLVAPRRVEQVVTVDGKHRWTERAQPTRRQIVWSEAERVAAPAAKQRSEDSHIRPQLADDGTLLYFTVRQSGGHYDIFRSRRVDGVWQTAEPVQELNSEANEIGPVIRADGQQLYFYSDREGGFGGMDLYASSREGDRWSKPVNLGPSINSPAHEYDPAISSDGRRLFYASNRSRRLHEKLAAGRPDQSQDHWETTLRADLGLQKFDLYVATRNEDGQSWNASQPLDQLNLPNSNEGAPYVSPDDAFLYFVSDRPERDGEAENFDIYRARISNGEFAQVENLGPGVNTAANEIEPSLSPEGFRVFFSRNRLADRADSDGQPPADDEQYALYSSLSQEVDVEVAWDNSNWQAFVTWLGSLFRTLNDHWYWLLLALLLLALLAAILWYLREVSLRRLPLPGFLLLALLLHLLLGISSFFVYFGEEIVAQIKKAAQEVIVAQEVTLESNHQSHEPGRESYEKVADLQAPETTQPIDVARQVTEAPNVPLPTEKQFMQLPTNVKADLSTERPVVRVAPQQPRTPQTPQLTRRQVDVTRPSHTPVPLEQTEAVAAPAEQAIQPTEVAMAQQAVAPQPVTAAALPPRNSAARPAALTPEPIAAEKVAETPIEVPAATANVQRARYEMDRVVDAADAPVPTAEIAASEVETSQVAETTAAVPVEVAQQNQPAVLPSTRPLKMAAVSGTPMLKPSEADDIADASVATAAAAPPSQSTPATLTRAQTGPAKQLSAATENVDAIPVTGTAAESPSNEVVQTVAVDINRQADSADAADVQTPTLATAAQMADFPPAAAAGTSAEAAEREVSSASVPTATVAKTPLSRAAPAKETLAATPAAVEVAAIETEAETATDAQPLAVGGLEIAMNRIDLNRIDLNRASPGLLAIPPNSAKSLGGPQNAANPRLVVGRLEQQRLDAPVTISPIASRLLRRPARAPMTLYAEDNVNLRALLQRRDTDESTKKKIIEQFGGSDATLETIRRGLLWLTQHQHSDGHWGLEDFSKCCKGHKRCTGHGNAKSDTAATGLALLPLLGDGNTHRTGPYKDAVSRGITWLVKHQKPDGDLFTGGEGNSHMYSHGIATIALCEAFGMSGDEALRGPAQRAIDFIVSAQHESSGGWRYHPNQDGDTSVVGWQVMALKSGQMAELNVPQKTLDLAKKWLLSVAGNGGQQGQFAYQRGKYNPAMTAEGLLCMQYLGADRGSPSIRFGGDYLLRNLPKQGKETSYYWYYGTQVMFHLQGEHWQQWNESLHDMLAETQIVEGHMVGTWDPKDQWERSGGRIYSTSLRLLMLEVYYRHLPLFQVLDLE